jgi:hypothetical protein
MTCEYAFSGDTVAFTNRAAVAPASLGGQAPACRPASPCSPAGGSGAWSASSPSGAALLDLPAAGVSSTPPEGALIAFNVSSTMRRPIASPSLRRASARRASRPSSSPG